MTFADKLIRLRKKNGMSQEDLADKLGVSRQAISKWEGMLSVPDLQNVLKISELFSVSTDYLLKDSIVDENFGKQDAKAADEKAADAKDDEQVAIADRFADDEFVEKGNAVAVKAKAEEEYRVDGRLLCASGALFFIGAIILLATFIYYAEVKQPEVMDFVNIAVMMLAGFALMCSIKEKKVAIIGFAILALSFMFGGFNYFIKMMREPRYATDIVINILKIVFFAMATISIFVRKPVAKMVRAMSVIASVCALMVVLEFLLTARWDGTYFSTYPHTTYYIAMALIATALSGDRKKEYGHKSALGLAGVTIVTTTAMITVWFLIVLKAKIYNNTPQLVVAYYIVCAVLMVIGYVLLPWLICYKSKTPVKGVSVKKGYFNIAAHILLSCVLSFLWHWVWVYRVSAAVRKFKGGEGMHQVAHTLFYIFVPFYYIYWFYKHGHDISVEEEALGDRNEKQETVTIVFGVIAPLVGSVVLQDRLNAVAVARSESAEKEEKAELSEAIM